MPDLSVIIVNWNTTELLPPCVEAVRKASGGLKAEFIIVDNASREPPEEGMLGPGVIVLRNRRNLGYSVATNQGARLSKGEFLLLLNPDSRPLGDSIERLVSFARSRPEAGAVAPLLLNPDGSPQPSVRRFPTPLSLLLWGSGMTRLFPHLARRLPYIEPPPSPGSPPRRVEQPMASALLLRKQAWEEVGGMDERFFLYFSDVDLCLRLLKHGWEIWLLPTALVEHEYGRSTNLARPKAVFHSHLGAVLYFAKHSKGAETAGAVLCSAVLLSLLPLRLLLARRASPPCLLRRLREKRREHKWRGKR
ncbi:MAG TPA: glycosyltransferase family 2 protein [Armatimonadetes bacterium]|nr:glycosyltransferase family 2 protein [Armatimonadota bacterium]